jgi:8-oxo-dGTP pyrophosphatase MutT (NUDIX family)
MAVTVATGRLSGDLKVKWAGELPDPQLVLDCINVNLSAWEAVGAASVRVKLLGRDLRHLPFFISNGFIMNRISGTVVNLLRGLGAGATAVAPGPFAYIGCGALCINDAGDVLAVRDKYASGVSPWKLPGGLMDLSKDKHPGEGAVRECFEETSVRAEFMFIAGQRFTPHSMMFHRPDMYFVCRLRPLTAEIRIDPEEIADCRWLKPDEFVSGTYPPVREFLADMLKVGSGGAPHAVGDCTVYYTA